MCIVCASSPAGILRVAIDKLQGVQRNGGTTANQTRDVVHNAPYTVEQHVAHRLYLSVAVLQTSRMQTEFTFTDQPAPLTVIQRGGAQVSCRFRPHGPARLSIAPVLTVSSCRLFSVPRLLSSVWPAVLMLIPLPE